MNDLPYPPNEHAIISLTHMALSINPSLDPLTARNIAQAYLAAAFYPNRFARGDELIAQFKRLADARGNEPLENLIVDAINGELGWPDGHPPEDLSND